MPKLTGWEVTRILKKDEEYKSFKNIPIIMFSAMDDVKDKIEGYELGVEDYITKPFNFSEVLARIRAVLRHHELSRKLVRRERKIAHIESMNQSLVYFTQHLRQPVLELIEKSTVVAPDQVDNVKAYIESVQKECSQVLAALDGLEEEITELKTKKMDLDRGDHILEELEAKFASKFESWKKKQGDLKEVGS
jgi:response regulator RpfG family c-di-GMP phosphodiesterase